MRLSLSILNAIVINNMIMRLPLNIYYAIAIKHNYIMRLPLKYYKRLPLNILYAITIKHI